MIRAAATARISPVVDDAGRARGASWRVVASTAADGTFVAGEGLELTSRAAWVRAIETMGTALGNRQTNT